MRLIHRIKVTFVVLFFCSFVSTFSQESSLNKKITIRIPHETVSIALKLIQQKANVSFVYLSGTFDPTKTISLDKNNTSLREIMRELFPNPEISFESIGKNIVISKRIPKSAVKKSTKNSEYNVITNSDTLYYRPVIIYDTVKMIIKDTVTVLKHDTIQTEKIKTVRDTILIPKKKNDTEKGFYLGVQSEYGGWLGELFARDNSSPFFFNDVKKSEKIKFILNDGITVGFRTGHLGFETGLSYVLKNYRTTVYDYSTILGYDEEISWDIKEIPPSKIGDPTKYDSTRVITKIPIFQEDSVAERYNSSNKASYLCIPFQFNYFATLSEKFEMQFGVGAELMLLLDADGKILVSDHALLVDFGDYLRDYYFRAKFQLGMNYYLTKKSLIGVYSHYGFNCTDIFRNNYPIHRFENGISVGLSYRWFF
jgi:hypothetical protein